MTLIPRGDRKLSQVALLKKVSRDNEDFAMKVFAIVSSDVYAHFDAALSAFAPKGTPYLAVNLTDEGDVHDCGTPEAIRAAFDGRKLTIDDIEPVVVELIKAFRIGNTHPALILDKANFVEVRDGDNS